MVRSFIKKLFATMLPESDGSTDRNGENSGSSQVSSKTTNESISTDLNGFVDFVVKSLVEFPEEVHIETGTDSQGDTIKISCKKSELRKIIGKNGKTINAIRSLVRGAAKRSNQSVNVVIVE